MPDAPTERASLPTPHHRLSLARIEEAAALIDPVFLGSKAWRSAALSAADIATNYARVKTILAGRGVTVV